MKLRAWANRDDGRHFRVGNRVIGAVEAVGLLLVVGAIFLWQAHVKLGIRGAWACGSGVLGFLIAIAAQSRSRRDTSTRSGPRDGT